MTRKLLITGASGFIGTNYVDRLIEEGIDFTNLDKNAPKKAAHEKHWQECDILDREHLATAFKDFRPNQVIHMAADTDTFGDKTLDDYRENTEGSKNVIRCAMDVGTVERMILTSSQFVVGPGSLPNDDLDFRPHTVYGESKAQSERTLREMDPGFVWTITRPTNIWGPWHPRYAHEFWRVLRRGLYFHPGRQQVMRCYGYVGNIIEQMERILAAAPAAVNQHVLYLGDPALDLITWVDAFSRGITGKKARVVPISLLKLLALVGDVVAVTGRRPLISSSRLRSMTQDYLTPMDPTFEVCGMPRYSLEQAVDQTIEWLRTQPNYTDIAPVSRVAGQ